MNTLRPAAALVLALVATSAAIAQESTQDHPTAAASRSRAEVRAELEQARAAGLLEPRHEWVRGGPRERAKSTLTREQVLHELQNARAAGRLDPRGG